MLICHDENIVNTNEEQKWARRANYPTEDKRTPTSSSNMMAEQEGYWNSESFISNVKDAVKIAEFKYKLKIL